MNGKIVLNPDHWVDLEQDRITLDGQPLRAAAARYILLYKPTGTSPRTAIPRAAPRSTT